MTVPAIMLLPEGDAEDISAALEGLIARDRLYLRRHPSTPHPYALGLTGRVRYHFEYPGAHWWTPGDVLAAGWADCKDLAAWWCAYEREAGRGSVVAGVAYPRVIVVPTGPQQLHAIAERECGCREDPSIVLGMPAPPGGAPWLRPTSRS